jgi:hypothetical protein
MVHYFRFVKINTNQIQMYDSLKQQAEIIPILENSGVRQSAIALVNSQPNIQVISINELVKDTKKELIVYYKKDV